MHDQTRAVYRLLDEIKAAHPGLEIESCSSGGARVDLGVLERTDRVWVSDCIDPMERLTMHRWTTQLIPPELMAEFRHEAVQRERLPPHWGGAVVIIALWGIGVLLVGWWVCRWAGVGR